MKKRNLILPLLITILISVISCSGAKKKADILVTDAGVFPRYLELIPSDTPYVFASTEALPEQVVDILIEKMRPMTDTVAKSSILKGNAELTAIWEEVGKKLLAPKGFEALGLVKSPTFVVYGVGVLPAVRIQIGDGKKVRELFVRLEQRLGLKSTEETIGTQSFWSYSDGSDTIAPFAIIGDELVFGLTHTNAAEVYTKYLLGITKPAESFAKANKFEQIGTEYGFMKFLVGYVDFAKVFESMTVESTSLNSTIAGLLPNFRQNQDAVCGQEFSSLIAHAPRMVFGYDKFDTQVAVGRVGIEITNGLSEEVAATKTSMPLTGVKVPDTILTASAGFDVGKLINLVQSRMSAIAQTPFQCKQSFFRTINAGARNAAALSIIPPAITGIKGGSFGLRNVESVDVSNGDPNVWPKFKNYIDGYALVSGDNPRGLLNVMSLMLPEFSDIKIKEDLAPVPLTLPSHVDEFKNPSVLLSNQYLALTAGMTTAADLGAILKTTTDNPSSPFAEIRYNMSSYSDLMERVFMQGGRASSSEKEMVKSVGTIFGDSETVVEFIPEKRGFFVKFEQPLK